MKCGLCGSGIDTEDHMGFFKLRYTGFEEEDYAPSPPNPRWIIKPYTETFCSERCVAVFVMEQAV